MALKGKGKNSQKDRDAKNQRDRDDEISRITRSFRSREHLGYPDQRSSRGNEEELVRHLKEPFRTRVLLGKDATE